MRKSQDTTPVRQNSTYTPTRKYEVNLRRNPTLHFQIGLILALLASIFFIEMRLPESAVVVPNYHLEIDNVFTLGEVRSEPKKEIQVQKLKDVLKKMEPIILDNLKPEKNHTNTIETIFKTTEPAPEEPMINPSTPAYVEYDDEPVSIISVEQVPLFPGCEGLSSNDERRDCMSSKISKFVSRKFRTDKAEGLGLEGQNRIFVLFKIDKEGNVTDVKARAPHTALEKEAKRVTELLPKMTPGKMGSRNVTVTMALPINFIIQD